jgi:hypothetical protein
MSNFIIKNYRDCRSENKEYKELKAYSIYDSNISCFNCLMMLSLVTGLADGDEPFDWFLSYIPSRVSLMMDLGSR